MIHVLRSLLTVLLCVSATSALAQIAFVAACSDFEIDNNTTLETPSCAVAGSNLYMVAFPGSAAGTAIGPTTVKWGGAAGANLTQEGTTSNFHANGAMARYHGVPAASTTTAHVTWGATQDEVAMSALAYSGVGGIRTSPTPTTAENNTATITATTVAGDMLVGCVWALNSLAGDPEITGFDGTTRGTTYGDMVPTEYEAYGCGEKVASGTSTSLTWTLTDTGGSNIWAVHAFVLTPAGAGAGAGIPKIVRHRQQQLSEE